MALPVQIPQWFHGWDIVIDSISVLAALLISLFSYRAYKLTDNKKYFVFFLAFLLIGLSFILKIGIHAWLYYKIFTENTGKITVQELSGILDVKVVGSFLYRLSMLLGLLAIFSLLNRINNVSVNFLFVYFIAILTFFSNYVNFVYHITATVMLFIICSLLKENAKRKKTASATLVFIAFTLLLASQLLFVFEAMQIELYAIGESVQLLGFSALIIEYILVWYHGNKKTQV
ncbi:MAG: hypothetical protein QW331_00755 [Candidatus Woesearchaeota archaeon]